MAKLSKIYKKPDTILLTGGVGDIIALESFMDDEFIINLRRIAYATRATNSLMNMFKSCPKFDHIEHHVLRDGPRVFFDRRGVVESFRGNTIPPILNECIDLSILDSFYKCQDYIGTSFIENRADISRFDLPKDYWVLCPASVNFIKSRDFGILEWEKIQKLELMGYRFVVLGMGNFHIPTGINLMNKTTWAEALKITYGAIGYIGIDSALSVYAAKVMNSKNLIIRMSNDFTNKFKHVYYAPNIRFPFLGEMDISGMNNYRLTMI